MKRTYVAANGALHAMCVAVVLVFAIAGVGCNRGAGPAVGSSGEIGAAAGEAEPAPEPALKKVADPAKQNLAVELLRLRRAAHGWLRRDLAPEKLATNQAYADLIFAFGLARLGQNDASRNLLKEASGVLDREDVVQRCFLRAFSYRIEEALAGRPHAGPLSNQVLVSFADLTKLENGRRLRYTADRMRDWSRIVEPHERCDAYEPLLTKVSPVHAQLASLAEVHDKQELEKQIRSLLKTVNDANAPPENRVQIMVGVIGIAPRVGSAFTIELLQQVLPLLNELGTGREGVVLERQGALLERSLALAAYHGQAKIVAKLIDWSGGWLQVARGGKQTIDAIAAVLAQELRSLKKTGTKDDVRRWLARTKKLIENGKSTEELRNAAGQRWPQRLEGLLCIAAGHKYLGEGDQAEPMLAEARKILYQEKQPLPGAFVARVAIAYVVALSQGAPKEVVDGLEELFAQMSNLPNTFSTATHFSRWHLMILEAAVLGIDPTCF